MVTNAELSIPGYVMARCDRNRCGGGVLVYYNENLSCEPINISAAPVESVWLKVKVKKDVFIIGNVYRPPNSGPTYLEKLLDVIEQVYAMSDHVVLLGDLNFDCLANRVSPEINMIESIFNMHQLVQTATRETLTTKTLLDVILTNRPEFYHGTKVCENSASDHYPVLTRLVVEENVSNAHSIVQFRCYSHFDVNSFLLELRIALNELSTIVNTNDVISCDPNDIWDAFKGTFLIVSDKHAPFKTRRLKKKHCPWVTHDVVQLIHRRDFLHRKAIHENCVHAWEEYKSIRNQITSLIKREKKKYYHRQFGDSTSNSRKFWQNINHAFHRRVHESIPHDLTANDFNTFFVNMGHNAIDSMSDSRDQGMPWKNPECEYRFRFEVAEIDEIKNQLKKLPNDSSCDILGFDTKLLSASHAIIAPILCFIINCTLFHGSMPNDWKFSRVTPIYKGKGSKKETNNYRPISVIPHIAKITERIVQKQLLTYLLTNDLICAYQSAYRPKNNTQTALHRVVDTWLDNLTDQLLTGVCFLDIRKCFDSINHDLLKKKMSLYGVRDVELLWFTDYLDGRKQTVKHNGFSDVASVTTGVPQGSVLGPILFLIFINDICQHIGTGTCNLYADDAVLFCQENNLAALNTSLQNGVSNISDWYRKNQLALNSMKCEVMLIQSKKCTLSDLLDIKIDNIRLNQVNCATYLGLKITSDLKWNDYVEMLCKKISVKIAQMRSLSGVLPTFVLKQFYISCVQPCIDYAISVWGNTSQQNINKIQRMQNYAARIVTNNYDYINHRGVNLVKQLNWMNVKQRCIYFSSILMYKCLNSLAPDYLCDEFILQSSFNDHSSRSVNNVFIPHGNHKSFSVHCAILWNNLPNSCKAATSLYSFKKCLQVHVFNI